MRVISGINYSLKNFVESLEISVKVININVDKENPILQRCKVLKEYSEFIEQVRFNIECKIPDPFTNAIKQSSKNGFLSDYLQRKSTEVQNMLLMEYDYATDIEVQREEAFEKGVSQGISQGIQQGISQGIQQGEHLKAIETAKKLLSASLGSFEQIAQVTGLSLETIKDLADNL